MKTASMTMEMKAVTHTLYWLEKRKDDRKTQAVIFTDSMSLLQKVKKGTIHSVWIHSMQQIGLGGIKWIYCPGHGKSRATNRQISYRELQDLQMVLHWADQRYSDSSETFSRQSTNCSTTVFIDYWREANGEAVANCWRFAKKPSSTKLTWSHVQPCREFFKRNDAISIRTSLLFVRH